MSDRATGCRSAAEMVMVSGARARDVQTAEGATTSTVVLAGRLVVGGVGRVLCAVGEGDSRSKARCRGLKRHA